MSVVQPESTPHAPLSLEHETVAVLRFPQISQHMWYRVLEIADSRGELPMRVRRLARFLSQQELDAATGRVIGQWDTGRVDGGLTLAHGYALTEHFGDDRFWDDLKEVYRAGFAEQVVKPAPGRRAVYALCLRVDAIPADLPDDLMRQLKVWDIPEAEDRNEDAAYGRLASRPPPPVEQLVVQCGEYEWRQLTDAPRWEHPAGSKAAAVAEKIRETAKLLPTAEVPHLHATAVADPDRTAEMATRVHRLMATRGNGKTSPLYAKEFSQLVGFMSTGSSELSSSFEMEKTKRTPSAAPGKGNGRAFGEDFSAVATRVQRRVWHSWRTQLGRSEVFLSAPTPEEQGRSLTGSAWSDLHHTMTIALRRGATESQLVELLTGNVIRHDQWGQVMFKATNVGRLAGFRLWKFINERPNAHGYGRRREVPQARHVTAWDETTAEERAKVRARIARVQETQQRRELARIEAAAAGRAERHERWGLDRWAREPEDLHQHEQEERHHIERPASRTADSTHAAALAKARAEKRARRRS